jgi:phosphoserine aminotransferase
MAAPDIAIPDDLLPADGRFGCGPSKVRPEAVEALLAAAPTPTSAPRHRQAPVQASWSGGCATVSAELFALPDGYEVVLGNGGTTVFWDAATFGLIERAASTSCSASSRRSSPRPPPRRRTSTTPRSSPRPGHHPDPSAEPGVDLYASPTTRPRPAWPCRSCARRATDDGARAVDATSAAGGLRFDPNEVDVYYFAPQKCLASDGGLWLAACSPAAVERIERIAASDRWIPASLDLGIALDNSRKDQTYNTPALATLFLAVQQIEWINENGGLEWAAGRCDRSAEIIYGWAEARDYATPFVADPAKRSHVVATIDLDDAVDADDRLAGAAGQRHRRHRQLPQARPQPAAHRRCSRPSTRRRRRAHRCIDHVVEALGS